MKQIDRSSPKPLRDVWAWKDAIYREVKDLPIDQALTAILDRAEQTGRGIIAFRKSNVTRMPIYDA